MRLGASIVIIIIIIGLVAVMAAPLLETGQRKSTQGEIEQLYTIIDKALIQCYALEGSYPPNLQYLQDNYGLVLNDKKYLFVYETGGMSNLKPEVDILPNQYEKARTRN